MGIILLVSFALGIGLLLWDGKLAALPQKEIKRNAYGEGDRKSSYDVVEEGENKRVPVEITVGETQYTKQELKEVFQKSAEQLEILILGDNESLERVSSDLNLITAMPGAPIRVEWELDRYDLLYTNGELQTDNLEREGEGALVMLKAYLTYTEDETKQVLHEIPVRLYPPKKTGEEGLARKIQTKVEEEESKHQTKEKLSLPKNIDGKEVAYYAPMNFRGITVLGMGIVMVILLGCLDKQDKKQEKKNRENEMMRDYPEIVNQLTLLLGAGMTCKNAWGKIVEDYRKRIESQGQRAAYEEMKLTWNEMQSGITERECYERFGRRCGVQSYIKLGALLSQNLRRGTKGITDVLRIEGIHAFEQRKASAKRQGEEAGTKLLLPMFFMLGIVLVIVVVPAFLSIQL